MSWTKVTFITLFCLTATMVLAQAPRQAATPTSVREAQPVPSLTQIVERMEQAALTNREHYQAYVVSREYRMYGGSDQKPSSTVFADVMFVPPKTKEFRITDTEGSSRGTTVVRHVLEGEQKATQTGHAPGAVSRDNYDFDYQGIERVDGHDCFVLGLSPKRKEQHLVSGRAWVDTQSYLIRKVIGDMAKMPSWWIKSVKLTFDFDVVDGMWLQTGMVARADVRIFGPHTLQENSLKVRTGAAVADLLREAGKDGRTVRTDAILGSFQQ